jgi:hypothetical protein
LDLLSAKPSNHLKPLTNQGNALAPLELALPDELLIEDLYLEALAWPSSPGIKGELYTGTRLSFAAQREFFDNYFAHSQALQRLIYKW